MKIRFSYGFTTVSPILKTWHMANKPLFEKKSSIPNSTIYGFQPFIFGVLPCLGQTHDSYPVRLRLNPAQSDPDPDLLQTGHKVCALGYSFLTVRPAKDVGYFKRNQNIQCICGCFCVFKQRVLSLNLVKSFTNGTQAESRVQIDHGKNTH